MTALEQYVRLEAIGQWRDTPHSTPREVIVSFGDASLVITDIDDAPLAHWSLAATKILSEIEGTAIIAPDSELSETLELADPHMIAAIHEVTGRGIRKPAGPRRKGKAAVFGLFVIALAVGAGFKGPDFLRKIAYDLIRPEQAALVSEDIWQPLRGRACTDAKGRLALENLMRRTGLPATTRVTISHLISSPFARLPDGQILIDASRLGQGRSADSLAGWLALAHVLPPDRNPLKRLIEQKSVFATLNFIFTGEVGREDINWMISRLLTTPATITKENMTAALELMAQRGIHKDAFLLDLSQALPSAAFTVPIPAPVIPTDAPVDPALTDQDWVALQGICDT